ncbi:hypothetical protein NQ314_010445, partial [Rhamnusium bicolor]
QKINFIRTVQLNYDKLKNKDIVNILWREILKDERYDSYLDQLIEYSFHYPVDTEAYLEDLHLKFDDLNKEELRTIDGHLKAYLITFLYYCTKCDDYRVSLKTTVMASSLYLKLVLLPGIGKIFYERNMYKVQLITCIHVIKDNSIPGSSKIFLLKLIKKFCMQQNLEPFLLKGTANTFAGVIMIMCSESIDDIRNVPPVPLYAINSLRDIVLNEDDGAKLKCVLESLFRCLRKCVTGNVPNRRAAVDIVVVIIRDVLQQELDEDKFQYLLDGFCATWGQEDFDCYEDAVVIMNLLKNQYYKELVRRMVVYTQSKNHKRYLINIMHLLKEIVKNLPSFSLSKVEVLYSCAVRNVLYQFVSNDKNIADKAIDVITQMCMLKDNSLLSIMFNHFQCTGKFINISAEALFLAFIEIADEKWGISPRNHNLLIIFSKFLSHTRNVNIELIQNTLKAICKDGTPSSLKPTLPILHELFCIMALKEEVPVAQAHIFQSMDQDVSDAITNLDFRETGSAVLLCCLLEHCAYSEIKALAIYIIDNFAETLIMDGLFQQSFPVPSVKPAYDLFQTIRRILKLPKDEEKLNHLLNVTSERAYRRLHLRETGDNSVFMYLNEVCLLLRKLPSEGVLRLLESYMDNPNNISVLMAYMPDIYIQLLTLFTTLAMMNKRKAPLALKYLHENLNNEEKIVRVLAFKLLFSLCQEITHEYGLVIQYSFKEMVIADPC